MWAVHYRTITLQRNRTGLLRYRNGDATQPPDGSPRVGPGDLFGIDRDVYYFGSAHPGGFNGIFADGSIRGLNYDIDVVLFNALGTRAGEEVVDDSAVN